MDPLLRWIQYSGLTLLGLGALLAALALLSDWSRTRGRLRRCPRCWYDMSAVQSLTCPECGRTPRHERRLHRSRRRWITFALGSLLLVIGTAGASVRWIYDKTWPDRIPARLLIALLDPQTPAFPSDNWNQSIQLAPEQQQVMNELIRRADAGRLSLSSRRALARHQFSGTTPVTFTTRANWPAGVPLRVVVAGNFQGVMPREARAIPRFAGGLPAVAYTGGLELQEAAARGRGAPPGGLACLPRFYSTDAGAQSIGIPPAGSQPIEFDVTITENGSTIWTGTCVCRTLVGGAASDIMHAVRDQQLDSALHRALLRHFDLSPDAAYLRLDRPALDALMDVAVALRVELVHAGAAKASAWFRWRDDARQLDLIKRRQSAPSDAIDRPWMYSDGADPECWSPVQGDTDALRLALQNPDGWTLRITPFEELALADLGATSYWAGSIEMPLRYALRAPPDK